MAVRAPLVAHSVSFASARARAHALKVNIKTKKWGALLCAGETATQRLRALYVAVPMCGHNGAKGARNGVVETTRIWPRVGAPSSKRQGGRGEKNTPSYLVHFYPLKQFQHCFKIVLSRVIVLCMRPRSSGLRWCARTLDSSSHT